MEEKTIWERIAEALLDSKIETYPPATKNGECTSRYVVVKANGSSQAGTYSSEYHYYTLLLYVPQNEYTSLERFKAEVKEIMHNKLFPMLMPTGLETPDFFDDTYNAHMVSIQYRNNVRNKDL